MTKPKLLIGIAGNAGSGKNTFADILTKRHAFVQVAFADPLKRIVRDVYQFSQEQLWGPSDCRNAPDPRYPRPDGTCLSPREALQTLGTEWGRNCYPQTWTDLCIRVCKKLLERATTYDYSTNLGLYDAREESYKRGVVITDVRYPNEVKAIKDAGGIMLLIERPGSGLAGDRALHSSETMVSEIPRSEFDHVIINNGTLEDLDRALDFMLRFGYGPDSV